MTSPSESTSEPEYVVEQVPTVQVQLGFAGMKTKAPEYVVAPKTIAQQPKTEDGLDTQVIIGKWTKWMAEKTEVVMPSQIRARLGKQVRLLILDHYESKVIIWALSIWSLQAATRGVQAHPPEQLAGIAWKFKMDASEAARRWRDEMTVAVKGFGNTAGISTGLETKTEQRQMATATALEELRRRKAAS